MMVMDLVVVFGNAWYLFLAGCSSFVTILVSVFGASRLARCPVMEWILANLRRPSRFANPKTPMLGTPRDLSRCTWDQGRIDGLYELYELYELCETQKPSYMSYMGILREKYAILR